MASNLELAQPFGAIGLAVGINLLLCINVGAVGWIEPLVHPGALPLLKVSADLFSFSF